MYLTRVEHLHNTPAAGLVIVVDNGGAPLVRAGLVDDQFDRESRRPALGHPGGQGVRAALGL
jgi:hypothetical protein